MTHFKAALMYISLRKKLHYYPSSIITHKNISTTPFITCNTCYRFSCLFLNNLNDNKLWSCQKMCDAFHYHLDNTFIRFGLKLYRQIVGIQTCPLEAVAFRDNEKNLL